MRYWITKGQQAVKKITGTCITCKRLEGISYRSPPTVPLPDLRVNKERPFKYTGIDYCGPIDIYQNSKSYLEELHCFDDLRSHKNDTLRISERFISNITCLMFEEIRWKKEDFQN